VKWLLHDEIVSNLRHIAPIQTDTLTLVSQHIHTSQGLGKANVSVDNVPLQFVFGQDQSVDKFTEVSESINRSQNIPISVLVLHIIRSDKIKKNILQSLKISTSPSSKIKM